MYISIKKMTRYTIPVSKFLVQRSFKSPKVCIIKNIR